MYSIYSMPKKCPKGHKVCKCNKTPKLMKVKDLDGDEKFKGVHPNLPSLPSCCILVGAIKSSKSNLIINFLMSDQFYKDKFDIVRVMSTTLHMDDKGKLMNKFFDADDHYEDKFIDDIIESQGKFSKADRPTYCLILDDCLNADFCKRNNKLAYFMTKMRHYIDMSIISVQSINHIPPLIRAQARDIIIARQNNHKEKIKLMEQFSGLLGEDGDKTFMRLYEYCHKKPYQFMYIKGSENPAEVYFNFEEKIHPLTNTKTETKEVDEEFEDEIE